MIPDIVKIKRLCASGQWIAKVENGKILLHDTVAGETVCIGKIDAVPVVRCKDCKHYGWEQEPCHGKTQRFCKLHKGLVVMDRDTFCSYGERRCDNE